MVEHLDKLDKERATGYHISVKKNRITATRHENHMTTTSPFLYFAPIRGLTDALFRDTLHTHFRGFDIAIAPFINPQKKSLYEDKMIDDVLPGNNPRWPVIPQLLHNNAEDFLLLARRLADLGYTHVNWNLGCPAPMVARKKRGSGLLPYPEEILDILAKIMEKIPIELSIKTRLGFYSTAETLALLPELDAFPLKEIIIHARLGKQLYKGSTDPDSFEACLQTSAHEIVYNGDINNVESFKELNARFPRVNRWMLGRGALADPFLAETIKGYPSQNTETKRERLHAFHNELFARYETRLSGPGHLLGRLKNLWGYLIASYPGKEKTLKKILKSRTKEEYLKIVTPLLEDS